MNTRNLKLALTVDLMNLPQCPNMTDCVREVMRNFSDEAGDYVGEEVVYHSNLEGTFEKQTLALLYEKYTLDLNLVTNISTQSQFLNGFNLKVA